MLGQAVLVASTLFGAVTLATAIGEGFFWPHLINMIVVTMVVYLLISVADALDEQQAEVAKFAESLTADDRARIERNLHDTFGHLLAAIVVKGELSIRLHSHKDIRYRREVAELAEIARSASTEIRQLVDVDPLLNLEEELASARSLLTAADARYAVDVVLNQAFADREIGNVLSWAVREGTTNALLHSALTSCTIEITEKDGWCEFKMINDGIFPAAQRESAGTGLKGLRCRVTTLRGQSEAGVLNDGRFRLQVRIPVVA